MSEPPPSRPSGKGEPSAESSGSESRRGGLADRLSELARNLQQEQGSHDTLLRVVHGAIEMIPGAEEGSISVVLGRRAVNSQAPSGDLPDQIDAVQTELGEGPCLRAVYEHKTVRVPDLSTEQRWPEFATRAYDLGAGSMLSFQLHVEGDNLGALNLYGRTPHAFDAESEDIGLLFASHAAVAFADVREQEGLLRALESRDAIGQAKGILMERHKITALQAFDLLVRASQQVNRKLWDVADELVETGELPGRSQRR
jgi:GAF domain-containing protein